MVPAGCAVLVDLVTDASGQVPLPDGQVLAPGLGTVLWAARPQVPGSPVLVLLAEPVRVDDLTAHNVRVRARVVCELERADEPLVIDAQPTKPKAMPPDTPGGRDRSAQQGAVMWFPRLRWFPRRRTAEEVGRELVRGLKDGSITFRDEADVKPEVLIAVDPNWAPPAPPGPDPTDI